MEMIKIKHKKKTYSIQKYIIENKTTLNILSEFKYLDFSEYSKKCLDIFFEIIKNIYLNLNKLNISFNINNKKYIEFINFCHKYEFTRMKLLFYLNDQRLELINELKKYIYLEDFDIINTLKIKETFIIMSLISSPVTNYNIRYSYDFFKNLDFNNIDNGYDILTYNIINYSLDYAYYHNNSKKKLKNGFTNLKLLNYLNKKIKYLKLYNVINVIENGLYFYGIYLNYVTLENETDLLDFFRQYLYKYYFKNDKNTEYYHLYISEACDFLCECEFLLIKRIVYLIQDFAENLLKELDDNSDNAFNCKKIIYFNESKVKQYYDI